MKYLSILLILFLLSCGDDEPTECKTCLTENPDITFYGPQFGEGFEEFCGEELEDKMRNVNLCLTNGCYKCSQARLQGETFLDSAFFIDCGERLNPDDTSSFEIGSFTIITYCTLTNI